MTRPLPRDVPCHQFADAVTDLVVQGVTEPDREVLLAHAHTCARCAAELADVIAVTDELLLLAPVAEPPEGFESRALARSAPQAAGAASARAWRRALGRVAAVALVLTALAGGVAIGRAGDRDAKDLATATIVTSSGAPLGTVDLDGRRGVPRIVVAIASDLEWEGEWICELADEHGTWVAVGSWTAAEATGGVWAAAVPPHLADSDAMRILGRSGHAVATARFDR